MPRLCDTDDVQNDAQPSSCHFCLIDSTKLYCCPKCKKFYCSLKCYKTKQHASCSEQFYKDQIERTMYEHNPGCNEPETKVDERLRTATSFEDYMKKMREEDDAKCEEDQNPQIEIEEDEEVLFDSDEEPEYLSKILDKTVIDYEKADVEDVNMRLMKAGIGSLMEDDEEQMEKLYSLLNDDEKKAFTRLAEKMHYDEIGMMLSRKLLSTRISLPTISNSQYSTIIEPKLVDIKERQTFVTDKISEAVSNSKNRLFAVIYAHNRQFKVSQNDIIHLHYNSILDIGQKIQLEKVLLVGGRDFTLFGRPLLNPELVKVYATVVEKTAISPELDYLKVAGKKVNHMRWLSRELNVLRINEIVVDQALLNH